MMGVLALGLACCLLRAAHAAFPVPAGAIGRPPWNGGGREEEAAALRVGHCCPAALLRCCAAAQSPSPCCAAARSLLHCCPARRYACGFLPSPLPPPGGSMTAVAGSPLGIPCAAYTLC